jgi:glycosyltransferase involved in cell wall biosynthesis
MKTELMSRADSQIPGRVTFTGFLNQSEISNAYKSADVFVLPSRFEPWGLVVNEAMNFGLPCIVSDRVGCGPDLVVGHDTGAVFPFDDPSRLSSALGDLLNDPQRTQDMGVNALRRIDTWDFARCARGIAEALDALSLR